jgi:hypothetical protein
MLVCSRQLEQDADLSSRNSAEVDRHQGTKILLFTCTGFQYTGVVGRPMEATMQVQLKSLVVDSWSDGLGPCC